MCHNFIYCLGAMDALARGLKNAAKVINDGVLARLKKVSVHNVFNCIKLQYTFIL